jgi:hypothetical protein
MDVRPATIRSTSRAARSRGWRSLLAGLISLALVLSFFHGWVSDGDDDAAPAVSIAQSIVDTGDKTPAHPAPLHGDHCLTHVSSVAPQDTAVTIEYAPHRYADVGMRLLSSADRLSPFKPPRA